MDDGAWVILGIIGFGVFSTVTSPSEDISGGSSTRLEDIRDAPEPSASCVVVSRAKLDVIASSLTVGGGGSLREGVAHPSGAHQKAYFIAAEIDGPGPDLEGQGDHGVWFASSLEPTGGMLLAVPNMATEFSDWPDASTTAAQATMGDPGAREAVACLVAAQGY